MIRHKLKYDLDHHIDAHGVATTAIVVRSRPGSACHREYTITRVPADSPRLAAFKASVPNYTTARALTVAERAQLLAGLWDATK